mgnify:FL=1
MVEVIVLSLIQGITEFIPVSSSSHLIIFTKLSSYNEGGLLLDVSLHIGSFLAVVLFFRKELIMFILDKRIFCLLLLASIPILISGYYLTKTNLINDLRTLRIIGWMTIIFALYLYFSDKNKSNLIIKDHLNLRYSLIIGLVHIIALIPGVSRSGIVISIARNLGFSRVDSAKISFLLSIPVLAGVSFYGLYETLHNSSERITSLNLMSIVFSFIVSYLTIKFFLIYIQRFNMNIFVIYRLILGILILLYAY